jgi:hypothetical protein
MFRACLDTIIATFEATPTPINIELQQKLRGCWEAYQGDTDKFGSTSASDKVTFDGQGRYERRGFVGVSVPGADTRTSESYEFGSYKVQGNTLHVIP